MATWLVKWSAEVCFHKRWLLHSRMWLLFTSKAAFIFVLVLLKIHRVRMWRQRQQPSNAVSSFHSLLQKATCLWHLRAECTEHRSASPRASELKAPVHKRLPFTRTHALRHLVTFFMAALCVRRLSPQPVAANSLLLQKVWALPWPAGASEQLRRLPLCFLVVAVEQEPRPSRRMAASASASTNAADLNQLSVLLPASRPFFFFFLSLLPLPEEKGCGLGSERCQAVRAGRSVPRSIWCQRGSQLVPRPCYSGSLGRWRDGDETHSTKQAHRKILGKKTSF